MTFPLYLMTLSSSITVPLWAYPLHYATALALGEIPATSRLRVCVGLLSVESVRGFPSPWLTFGATVRVSLSAGYDGWILHVLTDVQLWPSLACLAVGIVSFLDPVQPGLTGSR